MPRGLEGDATDLLKYMHEIQSIAKDGFDWASYDELYRQDLASTLNPPSWATVNQMLHNQIIHKWPVIASHFSARPQATDSHQPLRKSSRNFRPSNTSNQNRYNIPVRYCFTYHSMGKWCNRYPCCYKHKCYCYRSGKTHPQFLCKQKFGMFRKDKQNANPNKSQHLGITSGGLWHKKVCVPNKWISKQFLPQWL